MAAENSTNSLDDEMTALALQLEEVNIGNPRTKGKYPVGNPPDSTFAFDSFKAEVQAHLDFLKDRHLAVHLDSREEFSDEDALEIQPTDHSSTSYDAASRFDVSDNESEAEPSMTYTERQAKTLGKLIEEHPCSVCYEDFKAASLFTLDCGDRYCLGCLKGLFLRATADEMLFPPRCCREPIPLEVIRAKLSTNELSAFQDAEIEFSSTNRTYCSYPGCNRFIPPDWIEADRAECRRCSAETCVLCKNAYHSNSDCPEDPNLQATLSLADEQKWQRCYACRSMVEMSLGCNHMTCKCGAEFCYVCGRLWKTCRCEQWDEDRLVNRAHEIVDREAGFGEPDEWARAPVYDIDQRVQAMQNELRENHECSHSRWFTRIERTGRERLVCEMCAELYGKFLLQCPRCHIRICVDCRQHRIRRQ